MAKKTDAAESSEEFKGVVGSGDYFDAIADAMRSSGTVNPRELPDVTVEAIRSRFGK